MKNKIIAAAAIGSALLLAGASHAQPQPTPSRNEPARHMAQSDMTAEEGMTIMLGGRNEENFGEVNIRQGNRGFIITLDLKGMSEGWHGFHIHQTGDCSDWQEGFKASGGHMSVEGQRHGFLDETNIHAGDLPNIWVGETGAGHAEFYTESINNVMLDDHDGSAFVVHEGPDDYRSEPAGDSSGRVACGVIYPMKT